MTLGKLLRQLSFRKKRSTSEDSSRQTKNRKQDTSEKSSSSLSSSKRIGRSKSLNLHKKRSRRNEDNIITRVDEPEFNPDKSASLPRIPGKAQLFTFSEDPHKVSSKPFSFLWRKKSRELRKSTSITLYNINNMSKEVRTSVMDLCTSKEDVTESLSNANETPETPAKESVESRWPKILRAESFSKIQSSCTSTKTMDTIRRSISADGPNNSEETEGTSFHKSAFLFTSDSQKDSGFSLKRRRGSEDLNMSSLRIYNINNLSKEVQTSVWSSCTSKKTQTSASTLNEGESTACLVKSKSVSSLTTNTTGTPRTPLRSASLDPPRRSFTTRDVRIRSSSLTFQKEPENEDCCPFTVPRRRKSRDVETSTLMIYNINNMSREVQTSLWSLCTLQSRDMQTSTSELNGDTKTQDESQKEALATIPLLKVDFNANSLVDLLQTHCVERTTQTDVSSFAPQKPRRQTAENAVLQKQRLSEKVQEALTVLDKVIKLPSSKKIVHVQE